MDPFGWALLSIPDEETLQRGRGSCFRACHKANTGCFCGEPGGKSPQPIGARRPGTAEWGGGRPEASLAQGHWLAHLHPLPIGKPHTPAAKMSSKRAKAKTTKKRPQRATSNVFAMFDQSQIQEFKEAFNMIDQNRDGFIDKEDLHDMLASMGEQRRGWGAEWAHEGCSWSRWWGGSSLREHFLCTD